nr:unnamed protein product [Digitaria exilis]
MARREAAMDVAMDVVPCRMVAASLQRHGIAAAHARIQIAAIAASVGAPARRHHQGPRTRLRRRKGMASTRLSGLRFC